MKNIILVMVVGFGLVGCGDKPPKTESNTPKQEHETEVVAQEISNLAEAQHLTKESNQVNNAVVEENNVESLTGPQKNAVRSAQQYLRVSGFSRKGLIEQLSSSYGDGYDVIDATVAVDSLNADWNANAVRSAQNYLSVSGFSCSGLIEQLSSDFGDKYTKSEATYGAQHTDAC